MLLVYLTRLDPRPCGLPYVHVVELPDTASLSALSVGAFTLSVSHLPCYIYHMLLLQRVVTLASPHNQCLTGPRNIFHLSVLNIFHVSILARPMRANYLHGSENFSSTGGPRPTRQPLLYHGMSLSHCDYALHKVAPSPDSISPRRGPLSVIRAGRARRIKKYQPPFPPR